jgi:hypothetical protein
MWLEDLVKVLQEHLLKKEIINGKRQTTMMIVLLQKLKKLKNLKKEGKKDASYSNVPIDHSDVDAIKEIDDKERGVKYSDEEIKFKNETGLDGPEMNKNRKKAKRFVDFIQGKAARESTATQGSFKKGGLVKQGKPKLAKKGWR